MMITSADVVLRLVSPFPDGCKIAAALMSKSNFPNLDT